jgi:anti-sigma factor RsiW
LRTELRLAQIDPARSPEECRRFLPLLSRHLDGRLRSPQLEETLAHLERCERCQDALASMKEAQRRYRVIVPFPDRAGGAARTDR